MQIKKIKLNTQNVFVHFKIDIFDWQIAENKYKMTKTPNTTGENS